MAFHAPAVSIATGQNICVLAKLAYIAVLCYAAAPGTTRVLVIWVSAYVFGIVTSDANGLPLAHRRRVVPSGCLLWIFHCQVDSFFYHSLHGSAELV